MDARTVGRARRVGDAASLYSISQLLYVCLFVHITPRTFVLTGTCTGSNGPSIGLAWLVRSYESEVRRNRFRSRQSDRVFFEAVYVRKGALIPYCKSLFQTLCHQVYFSPLAGGLTLDVVQISHFGQERPLFLIRITREPTALYLHCYKFLTSSILPAHSLLVSPFPHQGEGAAFAPPIEAQSGGLHQVSSLSSPCATRYSKGNCQ